MASDQLRRVGLESALEKVQSVERILGQALMRNDQSGTDPVRSAIALALADGNPIEARAISQRRWGSGELVLKAPLAAGSSGNWTDVPGSQGAAFPEPLDTEPAIARASVRVPSDVPGILAVGSGAVAGFTAEGAPIPASRSALSREALHARKVAGLTVFSVEVLQSPEAEALVRTALSRAAAVAIDAAAFTPAVLGSVTNGQPTAASVDLPTDLAKAVELASGANLARSCWILHPAQAAMIAIEGGIARDVGPAGGRLLNMPVYTTTGSPIDQLTLVDASAVAMIDDGLEISVSASALIEQNTTPTGDSLVPTAASATLVSMFQSHARALRIVRFVNWARMRASAVSYITAIAY